MNFIEIKNIILNMNFFLACKYYKLNFKMEEFNS
jgi:hypothetical protein